MSLTKRWLEDLHERALAIPPTVDAKGRKAAEALLDLIAAFNARMAELLDTTEYSIDPIHPIFHDTATARSHYGCSGSCHLVISYENCPELGLLVAFEHAGSERFAEKLAPLGLFAEDINNHSVGIYDA